MGTIRYIAKVITERAESIRFVATNGDITLNAAQEVILDSQDKIIYGDYEPIEHRDTEVEEMRLNSKLEQGCHHDEDKGLREGLVYGQIYEFEVIKFKGDILPKDERSIKWRLEFTYKGNHYSENLSGTGKIIRLKANLLELCGRGFTLTAYISNAANGAKYHGWQHYRFRWFNREVLEREIKEREKHPWLTDQGDSPTCGMAVVFYLLAKKNFKAYQKFSLELHQKGIAECNGYEVNVNEGEHLLEMNPLVNDRYPTGSKHERMPYVDWINFSCVRDKENGIRKYNGENNESFDGSTVPNELVKLMKEILGFTFVKDNTNLVFNKGTLFWDGEDSSQEEIAKLQKLYEAGFSIIMLINSNMINSISSGIFSSIEHWVVFEGVIGRTITWNLYDITVFTWGQIKKLKISPDTFSSNYYGYVYGK